MFDANSPFCARNITDDDVAAIVAAVRAPRKRHATALRLLGQLASSVIHYQGMVELDSPGASFAKTRLAADLNEVATFLRGGRK